MPRNIRMYEKGRVYLVTNRIVEGLPLVPSVLINIFSYGILARAQMKYGGVKLCHFIFMGNHYHMVLVLDGSPDQLKGFMEFFDGEMGKVINRLRGTIGFKVWGRPYDAEAILTFEAALNKIVYLYLNPITAGLIDHIKDYPGVSSYKYLLQENRNKSYRFLGSAGLKRLPFGGITKRITLDILREKHSNTKFRERNPLKVYPFLWAECFPEGSEWSKKELREMILQEIKRGEKKSRERRDGRPTIGAFKLSRQCIHRRYRSKKYQKRSICISTCALLAKEYREEFREFVRSCKRAWLSFKETRSHVVWPPGAFPPTRPVMGSLLV